MLNPFTLVVISALLIPCLLASESYTERLEIYPLQSSSFAPKSLWHFTFEFQSVFDPTSHITQEAIPPRSILESIFVYSNATDLRIQVANGKPNSFLLDDGSFYFSLPKEGKTVYADQYAVWGNLMHQIHEIFSLSIQNLAERNYYSYNLDFDVKQVNESERREQFPNYEKIFFYGNDPVDYICNDFVEKIQTFAPCRGSKGLFTLLKVPDIFASDYVSSSVALHFDRAAKKSYFKVEFNVIGNPDLLGDKLTGGKCEGFSSSDIIDYRPKQATGSQATYEMHDDFSLFKIDTLPSNVYSKDILRSQRYLTNARFHTKADLIHEITNSHASHTIRGIVSEYFPSFTHPIFHQISLKMNNSKALPINQHMQIEYLKSAYTLLRFNFEIPPESTLRIKIPFEKLMRSFENYPHDPARGEDLVPSIIFYQISQKDNKEAKNKVFRIESNDVLAEMPHSDLSMPFTIIAIVMAAFGFLSMSIYRAIFENPKKVKESKLTIIKNKIKEKIFKSKVKAE